MIFLELAKLKIIGIEQNEIKIDFNFNRNQNINIMFTTHFDQITCYILQQLSYKNFCVNFCSLIRKF